LSSGEVEQAAQEDVEESFLRETRLLLEIPPDERKKYVEEVLQAFADGIRTVRKARSLVGKRKAFKRFMEEFKDKGETIMVCFLYSVKPEYRPAMVEFLKALVGEERAVRLPSVATS